MAALADSLPIQLEQEDTFFCVPSGRLKLREFHDGTAELIHYLREDGTHPKGSLYVRTASDDPAGLKQALGGVLGIRGVVRKRRRVFLKGQTRIHFDEVEGLGTFIEIEVVLWPEQTEDDGTAIAQQLMLSLGIDDSDLIAIAYVDLLEAKHHSRRT